MKKLNNITISVLISLLMIITVSCEKDFTGNINGKAQKGPFVTGANITINELNDDLEQTGKSFTTSISADDGSFSLNSVELASEIALITVNGYFFDENLNIVQNGVLNLQALVDISGKTTVNVNALTHVLKDRIEKLYKDGKTFKQASDQAKNELLSSLFGITDANIQDFDQMDITASANDNGLLLAFSAMMLRRIDGVNEVSRLTELLTKLRTDFKDDGIINNTLLKNQIWENVSFLNPKTIKNNIINKYQQMGINVNLSDFQYYINKYVEKHAPTLFTTYQYPTTSITASHFYTNAIPYTNILDKNLTSVNSSETLVLATITPFNKNVKIRITPVDDQNTFYYESYALLDLESGGWTIEKSDDQEFIITSQRENILVSFKFNNLNVPNTGQKFPINIEYFENGSSTPTFLKTVTFL